ncbi:MAG: hypothetical protein SFV23_19440, partial [Planctomycetaceae bacterium]|nr:hypothetical protein [Planctomycetaceae bacterium]
MPTATWLWNWLQERRMKPTLADPLARFAALTVQRLEDRRVLSATLATGDTGDVQVDVTGDDTVSVTFDSGTGNLTITDTDANTTDIVLAAADLDSLNFQLNTGDQTVEFVGTEAIPVMDLTIAGNAGTDNVRFDEDVFAQEGGILIDIAGDVVVGVTNDVDVSSSAGDITVAALGDITMSSGSSFTATNSFGVGLTAGDDLFAATIDSAGNVELFAGSQTADGSLITLDGQITVDSGHLMITGADDVSFTDHGDVTVTDGFLDVTAGTDAGDDLTMADDTTIAVSSTTTATIDLSAGGDIDLASISGTNLQSVFVTAGGEVSDATAAETANIAATSLAISAGTGVGNADDIDTAVGSLEAITASGSIVLHNSGALTIGGVTTALNGVDVTAVTGGAIVITSAGSMTVNEGISGPGKIDLLATGTTSNLTISQNSGVFSMGGDILLAADQTVTVSEDVGAASAGTITVAGNSGAGARNIVVNSGASVTTQGGDLTLDADTGSQIAGDFVGVAIDGSGTLVEVTGAGTLTVTGRGGNTNTLQHGVVVSGGAIIRGGASGLVDVEGRGGAGPNGNCFGVSVTGAGSTITSSGGDVSVTGNGGGNGTVGTNYGVHLLNGGTISSGGTGQVDVHGTGGVATGFLNVGVFISGSGATITSVGGDVRVVGDGGGTGSSGNNYGVYLTTGGAVSALSTGDVTVEGTGGQGTNGSHIGTFITGAGSRIESAGGDVLVKGDGGGAGTNSSSNMGVAVMDNGDIIAGGAGTLTIEGTGGASTGFSNNGVWIRNSGVEVRSSGGAISIAGQEGLGANNRGISIGNQAAVSNSTGDVSLISNSLELENTVSITGQTVTITQRTSTVAIDLGTTSDTNGGPLALSDAELDRITSDTLIIGNTDSGAINVSADLDLTDGPVIDTLVLRTGSTVTATGGGIIVGDLAISAEGAVTLTAATTEVTNLAIETTTGDVTVTESSGLAITTVGGIAGLSTSAGKIVVSVTQGNLTVADTAAAQDVSATTGVTIALDDDEALFTLQASAVLSTTAAGVSLAADKLDLQGMVSAAGQSVTLISGSAGDAVNLGSGVDSTADTLELSDAELDRITAGTLVVGNASAGVVTISAALSPTNVSTLELITAAAIVDGNATGVEITVASLALVAGTSIGGADALEIDVDNLAFRNITSGDVNIANTGALTLTTVGDVTGMMGSELGNFGGGSVIVSASSPITIAADVASVGSMTFTAGETDDAPNFEDDLTINSGVTVSVTGMDETLTLHAGDDVIVVGAAEATNGSLALVAGFNDLDDSGAISLNGGIAALEVVSLTALTGVSDGTGAVITADELEILGVGDAILDEEHDVDVLAVDLEGALTYVDADGFEVGPAGATTGITLTSTGSALTLSTANGVIGLNANVTTEGDQNYHSAVELLSSVVLTALDTDADGEGLEFADTLAGGGFDLTISGGAAFAAAVSGVDVFLADRIDTESTLAATSVEVSGTADLGDDVTTTETQVYTGAVLLTSAVDFQSSGTGGDGDVTFESTLDGGFAAAVSTAGTTTFGGDVGEGTALTSLTTNGGGTTLIDAANVTAGAVDFADDVTIDQTTTVTGSTSVDFGGTISGTAGSEDLTVVSTGTATVDGAISNLDDLTVDAGGLTTFSGDIDIAGELSTIGGDVTKIDAASIAAGTVTFSDAVELCRNLSITAGSITFSSTLDEASGAASSNLMLEVTTPAAGDITFIDAVGSMIALDSLTLVTANDVSFQSTVELVGDLEQQAGTGTTAFNGTGGTGIGGEFLVTTNEVAFSTGDVVTVGMVVISAQNAVTFHADAGLNAGASSIALNANLDDSGTEGLTQGSGTI